ncbi:phosphoribosyltransferase [Teredinibacter turnerae]|uniref:phosphoribosyltransferase n=1 Tax=Teredinibacter turnerae TaxID=2426 RepID=UPI000424D24D|nr:phosphoribosyltransferase [Teredinibacter turnerae]
MASSGVFSDCIEVLILSVLALATLISILGWVGFLPTKVSRYLNRNRLAESIDILKEFGVDIERHRNLNLSVITKKAFAPGKDIEESLQSDIQRFLRNGNISVGRVEALPVNEFLDLIGATTDYKFSELFARYLSTYWAKQLCNNGAVRNSRIDFIVTPKGGSPILGYEFSKLLGLPFALHDSTNQKFITADKNLSFYTVFDCADKPKAGSVALIVDDSATGGRKVFSAMDDLQRHGYKVTDCLVVFEPMLKDIRKRMEEKNLTLHSIIQRP